MARPKCILKFKDTIRYSVGHGNIEKARQQINLHNLGIKHLNIPDETNPGYYVEHPSILNHPKRELNRAAHWLLNASQEIVVDVSLYSDGSVKLKFPKEPHGPH